MHFCAGLDLEKLRALCMSFPRVTEDIKWENNLCFLIGGKMFCITSLSGNVHFSIKVKEEEFDELTSRPGIVPAPYLARNHWVMVESASALPSKELQHYIRQSYELVKSKLPKKILKELGF